MAAPLRDNTYPIVVFSQGAKKAIVALAHKMLRIIFAMLKNHTPYQDQAVDYEALLVQRNAPRWINNTGQARLH